MKVVRRGCDSLVGGGFLERCLEWRVFFEGIVELPILKKNNKKIYLNYMKIKFYIIWSYFVDGFFRETGPVEGEKLLEEVVYELLVFVLFFEGEVLL